VEKVDKLELSSSELSLQTVIQWSVWEAFAEEPVDGWRKDLSCVVQASKEERATKQAAVPTLEQIVNENTEKVVSDLHASLSQSDSVSLGRLQRLFQSASKNPKVLSELQNWTINQWYEMAAQLTARRATLDINHEFQELQKANQQGKPLDEDALGKSYVSKLLPLHMLVPGGDAGNYSGILLMFNKHFTVLAPTSRLKFYADPDGLKLLHEISAGREGKKEILPVTLNKGQVWVDYDPGSTAILPLTL